MYRIILLLCAVAALSYAQKTSFGPCPNIPAKTNFTGALMKGTWYMFARYPTPEDGYTKCMTATYELVGNSTFNVRRSCLNAVTSKETIVSGQAYFSASATSNGFFTFKMNGATSGVSVLETDYSTYSVLYGCQNFVLYHQTYLWIYYRPRFSLTLNLSGANAVLDRYGLNKDPQTLVRCDQINCPYSR